MYTDLILTIYIYFSVGTDILCVVGTTYYASSICKSSIVTDKNVLCGRNHLLCVSA